MAGLFILGLDIDNIHVDDDKTKSPNQTANLPVSLVSEDQGVLLGQMRIFDGMRGKVLLCAETHVYSLVIYSLKSIEAEPPPEIATYKPPEVKNSVDGQQFSLGITGLQLLLQLR